MAEPIDGVAVDGVSFDDFVRLHGDGYVRLAWLITRNIDDARDAVQDALVGVYPRWAGLVAGGRVEAYLYRSVVNASLSILRRRRTVPLDAPDLLPAAAPAEVGEAAAEAWLLCAELPPTQRAAVVLRFYRDLSFAQIGEVLGCPEATARSHVHRALVTLRSRLSKEVADD